jgi:hypothetical protein
VLFGLLSDCVPVFGMKRKPYFIAGWMLFMLFNFILAIVGEPNINQLTWLVSLKIEERGWEALFVS